MLACRCWFVLCPRLWENSYCLALCCFMQDGRFAKGVSHRFHGSKAVCDSNLVLKFWTLVGSVKMNCFAFRYGNLEMSTVTVVVIAIAGLLSIVFFVIASINTDTKGLIDSAIQKNNDHEWLVFWIYSVKTFKDIDLIEEGTSKKIISGAFVLDYVI